VINGKESQMAKAKFIFIDLEADDASVHSALCTLREYSHSALTVLPSPPSALPSAPAAALPAPVQDAISPPVASAESVVAQPAAQDPASCERGAGSLPVKRRYTRRARGTGESPLDSPVVSSPIGRLVRAGCNGQAKLDAERQRRTPKHGRKSQRKSPLPKFFVRDAAGGTPMTPTDMAERLGVTRSSVYLALKQNRPLKGHKLIKVTPAAAAVLAQQSHQTASHSADAQAINPMRIRPGSPAPLPEDLRDMEDDE
jgi:hypothetical protein